MAPCMGVCTLAFVHGALQVVGLYQICPLHGLTVAHVWSELAAVNVGLYYSSRYLVSTKWVST